MLTGFGLTDTLMSIHAEQARHELERQRLLRPSEIDPRWRPMRANGGLLRHLERLLATGRQLREHGMPHPVALEGHRR